MVTNIASYIDHTLLKPACTYADTKKLCEEAVQYQFAAVCIPPSAVAEAKKWISGSIKMATVIGFPFGYAVPKSKLAETEQAIADGTDELDVVINLMALKNGDWPYLEKEMAPVIELSHKNKKITKIIIESGVLSDDEIVHCCSLYSRLGTDFVKTSTGYAEKGATIEAVRLMRAHLPASVKIKASGGIKTYEFASQLIEAGAARLGCSASVAIVKEGANYTN